MQRQTTQLTKEQVYNGSKKWFLVDATGKPLGRLASEIAVVLMGKEKVDYTPSVDCGDYVIVINASKIHLSGNKINTKNYYDNKRSSYGGLRTRSAKVMLEKYPEEMIQRAVRGMIPHTSLGNAQFKKLFVYRDEKFEQQAQKPEKIELCDIYREEEDK